MTIPSTIQPPRWLLEMAGKTDEGMAVMTRLSTDPRMHDVLTELKKLDRLTGEFLHPAHRRPAGTQGGTKAEVQEKAIQETLVQAFLLGIERQKATKLEDAERVRASILADAQTLRRIADELGESLRQAPPYVPEAESAQKTLDMSALRRISEWKEVLASKIRGADDPMTVKNDTVDSVERGTQRRMASFLNDQFGSPLHGTAATLTAVILGLHQTPSAEISRSGFPKAPKQEKNRDRKDQRM